MEKPWKKMNVPSVAISKQKKVKKLSEIAVIDPGFLGTRAHGKNQAIEG